MSVGYVDPCAKRGWLYRLHGRLNATRLVQRLALTRCWGAVLAAGPQVDGAADLERLWDLAGCVFPAFTSYRQAATRSGRTIPMLQLTPAESRLSG